MGMIYKRGVYNLKKDYLQEYNEALEELSKCSNTDAEKRIMLMDKMQEIADSAVNAAVFNERLKNAFDECEKNEKKKIAVGFSTFVSGVVIAVGSKILSENGFSIELMNNINLFANKLALFSGSVTLAFLTVGLACKTVSMCLEHSVDKIKGQIGEIAFLPHNNLLQKLEENEKE